MKEESDDVFEARMTRPGVGTAGIKGSKRACGGLVCAFPAYIWVRVA